METCKELAEGKVADAKATAIDIRKKIENKEVPLEIVEFFPDFKNEEYQFRTNIPRGLTLPQFVLLGRQGIFDLEPSSSNKFLQKNRINIDTALELVERKVLIPNLYFRDPDAWDHVEHMYDLVKKSYVNGEYIDEYMRLRMPNYDDTCNQLTAILSKSFQNISSDRRQSLCEMSRAYPPEKLEAILAKRWGYLYTFNRSTADKAHEYLAKGNYESLARCIHIGKHQYVSAVSAAIGGKFVWGKQDILQEKELGGDDHVAQDTFVLNEELEYLLTSICEIKPFSPLLAVEEGALLKFIDNHDNIDVRNKIWELTYDLAILAQESHLTEAKVSDYKTLIEDYRRRLSVFEQAAEWGATALGGAIGSGIGLCFGGYGVVLGGAAGAWIGKMVDDSSHSVGQSAFRMFTKNRDAFYIMSTIDKLKKGR